MCGRKNLTLVWARNKNIPTTIRAHNPVRGKPHTDWCPGSGLPPKGTP